MKYILLLIGILSFSTLSIAQDARPLKEDNCLQLKGIVKNNAQMYADPSLSSYKRSVAQKFTILYMFEHKGTKAPVENGFYRVGKSSETPEGYILEKDVVQWNHRLCLGFTDLVGVGRGPSLIYRSKEDASEEDWDSNKRPNPKAISQEPESSSDIRYDMLLPVLEESYVKSKGRFRDRIKAFKVGYLGETGDGSSEKRPTYRGKSVLDLMFLMDATSSMQDEIDGAKQVVKSVINEIRAMENTEVKMGIALYKDFGDDFVTKIWLNLTSDYSEVLTKLSEIEVSLGGDTEEAMYQGVLSTINATNWSKADQMPVLKEILIIGDAPGKDYASGTPYEIDKDDLITKASEERVRFIAMNVGSDAKLGKQMADLRDGLTEGDQGLYLEANALVSEITDEYLNELSRAISGEFERLQLLEAVRSGGEVLEDMTPLNRAIFMKNLPSSDFDDIGIHFSEGWITEKNSNGRKQVDQYVYMTYAELNVYKFYCSSAITLATQPAGADKGIVELVKDKLTAISGEDYEEGTEIGDHLNKALCLPSSTSGLLSYSLNEIFTWSEKRKETFIQSIQVRVDALDGLLRNNDIWRKPAGGGQKYTFVKLELMP